MSLMAERWLPKFVNLTRLIKFVAYAWMCHVKFVWVVFLCLWLNLLNLFHSQLTCDLSADGEKTHRVRDIHKSHWIREVHVSVIELAGYIWVTADLWHECRWEKDALSSWHIHKWLSSWGICESLSSRDVYEWQPTCDMSAAGKRTHWVRDKYMSH